MGISAAKQWSPTEARQRALRFGPGGGPPQAPPARTQDAACRTRRPRSPKGTLSGEALSIAVGWDSFQVMRSFINGSAEIRKTDNSKTGSDVKVEFPYTRMDRHSEDRQTAALGKCSALPTEAGHGHTL